MGFAFSLVYFIRREYRQVPANGERLEGNCIDANSTAATTYGVIAGGQNNVVCAGTNFSSIFSGQNNCVAGNCSTILSGEGNLIDATSSVAAFGIIGGGQNNKVCAGTNYSSIFSGRNNTVSGSCSAILGGSGNNDGGFNYVGIFGCNVTGVVNNAFHVNELVMQNIPAVNNVSYGGLQTGQLYTIIAPPGFTARPVYVK